MAGTRSTEAVRLVEESLRIWRTRRVALVPKSSPSMGETKRTPVQSEMAVDGARRTSASERVEVE